MFKYFKPCCSRFISLTFEHVVAGWGLKISVFKSFSNFTGKHLRWSLKACNFIKKRLQPRCFPVKFAKFLRTPFFTEHLRWMLLFLKLFSLAGPKKFFCLPNFDHSCKNQINKIYVHKLE